MEASEREELEQFRLIGELSHALVHETNNFLYNVTLQIALLSTELSGSQQEAWASITRHSRHLTELLREWQNYPRPKSNEPARCELNDIVRRALANPAVPEGAVQFDASLEPLWVKCMEGLVSRLCRLLVREVVSLLAHSRHQRDCLMLKTYRRAGKPVLEFSVGGPGQASLEWQSFTLAMEGGERHVGLTTLAAYSLARRIGAKILPAEGAKEPQKGGSARDLLSVEWPAASATS